MYRRKIIWTDELKDQASYVIAINLKTTEGARKLIRALMDYEVGEIFTNKTLAEKMKVSEASIERYFRELKRKNLIAYVVKGEVQNNVKRLKKQENY